MVLNKLDKIPLIDIKDVSKIYTLGTNKLYALNKINLSIFPGEYIIIMGPSGSGKSTLMNIIGLLDSPTEGELFINGVNTKKISEKNLAKIRGKNIGFIFQQFNLIQTLSALQNVMLPLEFQNVSSKNAELKATELLNFVQLSDRIYHLPKELSGGQQQRVAIARALSTNPDVIFADEPTGNLDSKTGIFILDFLKDLNKQGKTIIVVTHDLSVAKQGHRVVSIIDGKISTIKKN